MKKEYLILSALILILGAYLLFHKENQNHYVLPEIKTIDMSKVTGLVITREHSSMELIKKEKNWVSKEREYPLDSSAIQRILDTLKTLKLSALVSQKEDLKRYELDDENHILFNAMDGEKVVFEFSIGKTAPSFNHTFVKLANDSNIYHANGSFRSFFDKSLDDFRDKKIMAFQQESIKQMTIEKDGISRTFMSKAEKKETESASLTWQDDGGASVDKEMVSTLLSSVSSLKCETYLDDTVKNRLEKEKPLCKIIFKNENRFDLSFFTMETTDNLGGIASMSPYAFTLDQFTGKEILSGIDNLLGIKKEDKVEN